MAVRSIFLAYLLLGFVVPGSFTAAQAARWELAGSQVTPDCASSVLTYFTAASGEQLEANRLEFSTQSVRWTQRAFFSDGSPIFESEMTLDVGVPQTLSDAGGEISVSGAFVSHAAKQGAGGSLTYEISVEGAESNGVDGPVRIDAQHAEDRRTVAIRPTSDDVKLSLRVRSSACATTWTWRRAGALSTAAAEAAPAAPGPVAAAQVNEACIADTAATGRVQSRDGGAEIFDPKSQSWTAIAADGAQLFQCMLVRTGANDRAMIAVSDPGGDIRVALSSDTLVEAPTSHRELTARRGAVYVVRPDVGEPASAKPFVFRLPAISATLAAPSQRFEFVLYHDDATNADAVLLNDGALDIEAGGRHLSLAAGQLLWSEGGTPGPVRPMPEDAWRRLSQARAADAFLAALVATKNPPPPALSSGATPPAAAPETTAEAPAPAADCGPAGKPTAWITRNEKDSGAVELFDPSSRTGTAIGSKRTALQPCMKVRTATGAWPLYELPGFAQNDSAVLDQETVITAPTRDGTITLEAGGIYLVSGPPDADGPAGRIFTFSLPNLTVATAVPQSGKGIEFYLARGRGSGQDVIMLHNGVATVSGTAGHRITLRSGQVARAGRGGLEAVRGMAEGDWRKLFESPTTPDVVVLTRNLPSVGEAGRDADPQRDANRLVVEARRAFDRAADLSGRERHAKLEEALGSLKLIVERYPTTDHAVTLIGGGKVAGISIPMLEQTLAKPPSQSGSPPAAEKQALHRIVVSVSLPIKPLKTERGQMRFGVEYSVQLQPFLALYEMDAPHGALVLNVVKGSPAEAAGIKPGDMVVRFGGRAVETPRQLAQLINETPSSVPAEVEVIRCGSGPDDLHERLRAGARLGDADMLTALGEFFYEGLDGHANKAEALRLFRLAGEKGNGFAAYRLGVLFTQGDVMPADHAQATRWYKLAVDRGVAAAETKLGYLYWVGKFWDGSKAVEDYALAVAHFRAAAKAGEAESYFFLGAAYQFGRGVGANLTEAARWYRLSIDKAGEPSAMSNLGNLYYWGSGVRQDYAEARRLYERAISRGNASPKYNLGIIYRDGKGVAADRKKALTLFREAAEAGRASAMFSYAHMLQQSGDSADKGEAVTWYQKASQAGNGAADYALALAYIRGEGVSKDDTQAGRHLIQALGRGNATAMKEMKTNAKAWPEGARRTVQRELQRLGHYGGKVDARFGPATIRAIEAYVAAAKQ